MQENILEIDRGGGENGTELVAGLWLQQEGTGWLSHG